MSFGERGGPWRQLDDEAKAIRRGRGYYGASPVSWLEAEPPDTCRFTTGIGIFHVARLASLEGGRVLTVCTRAVPYRAVPDMRSAGTSNVQKPGKCNSGSALHLLAMVTSC